MAIPVPAVVAAAGVGLLLLMRAGGKKTEPAPTPPPEPPPPPPSPPNVRPKRTPNPPPDAKFWGTVTPACGLPGDDADCSLGLLVHTSPNASVATRVGPKGDPRHIYTGEGAAIIRNDVPDQSTPKTSRVWAEIVTPTDQRGFVSFTDPQNRTNFANLQPITPPAPSTSGYGYGFGHQFGRFYPSVGGFMDQSRASSTPSYAYKDMPSYASLWGAGYDRNPWRRSGSFAGVGWAPQRTWVRCTAPSGCVLGDDHGRSTGVVVENGGMVQILSTSIDGQAALVRYHDRVHGRALQGWVALAWLQ